VGKIGNIAWSLVLKFLQEALLGGKYGEASTASSKNLPTSWNLAGQVIRNMGKSRQVLDITLSWSKAESEAGYHVAVRQNARFTCELGLAQIQWLVLRCLYPKRVSSSFQLMKLLLKDGLGWLLNHPTSMVPNSR
jgi:hypothetical protein